MFRLNSTPLVKYSVNHPWVVIITALIITAGLFIPVLNLEIQPDIESLLPEGLDEFYDNVSGNSDSYDKILVMVSGDELFTLDKLNLFDEICRQLKEFLPVVETISPFSFITLEKLGGRLMAVPVSPNGRVPSTAAELDTLVERLNKSRFAPGIVTSEERDSLAVYFMVEKSENYIETMAGVNEILEPLRAELKVAVTGTTPFSAETESFLTNGFVKLLIFVVLTILLSYYLGFRSKRAVFLPITLVLSGVIFSTGIMSLLGYKLTMVSIISPPLILTLGSSYSIHVMNAYYHAAAVSITEASKKTTIIKSVSTISSTVLLASFTTLIGLLSLMFATIPQTREFAIATALGIFFSALLSITVLPALLALQPIPKLKRLKLLRKDPLSRFLQHFGPGLVKSFKPSIIVIAVITAVFIFLTPNVEFNTSPSKYFPASSKVRQDLIFFLDKIGGYEELIIELKSDEEGYFLEKNTLDEIHAIENELHEIDYVSYLFSFPQYLDYASETMTGKKGNFESAGLNRYVSKLFTAANEDGQWVNEDFSEIRIQVMVFNRANTMPIDEKDNREIMNEIVTIMNNNVKGNYEWQLRGTSLGFLKLSEMMKRDFLISTLAALIMISILTSIVFKSVISGILSLIPLLMGIFSSFILMVIFNIPLDMTTIMVSCITIGVGVDDAIHFLLQHRDMELKYPDAPDRAVCETIIHTGRPIVITTLSIVAGLLFLALAKFQPIKYFGLLIVFTLFAACFSTIVILPAIVRATTGRKNVK